MLTLSYFMQQAGDLFGDQHLNNPGVIASFRRCLSKTREHIVRTIELANGHGSHEDLCYNFHVGTMLLMSFFDGLAVYVQKKLAPVPTTGIVYWHNATTFSDPMFAELLVIKDRTNNYIITGGVTAATLRNYSKHYLPCLRLPMVVGNGNVDVHFKINENQFTGPLIQGLLTPLFNDGVNAYKALFGLMGMQYNVQHHIPNL